MPLVAFPGLRLSALAFFSVVIGVSAAMAQTTVLNGNHSVTGNLCVGDFCGNNETFPDYANLKLTSQNTRILFQDTSNVAGYATTDWQLQANDVGSNGQNFFAIRNIDTNRQIFRLDAGALANSLYIDGAGRIGLGTSLPQADLHVVATGAGVPASLRLQTIGASPYNWEMQSNHLNWSVRNVTLNRLPFVVSAVADNNSLFISGNSRIGIGTPTPEQLLHIRSNTPNTDAFALFDANAAGSDAAFLLRQNGVVPTTWEFRNQQGSGRLNVGIAGGNTPFKIDNLAANNLLKLGINGNPGAVVVTGQLLVNNTLMNVPDYVFGDDYALRPLSEVQAFIDANAHLPDVPSAAEIMAQGVDMTAMQMLLLKKVEELTLYTLDQQKMIAALVARIEVLEN